MACHRIFQISHHMAASLSRNGVASIVTPCSSPASVFSSKLKHLPQAYRNCLIACKRCTLPRLLLTSQKSLSRKWTPFTLVFAPLSFFRRRKEPILDHAAEVLAHIPKEVFRKDDLIKKRKRRFFLVRIFIMLWNQLRFIIRFTRVVLTFGPLLMMYPLTYASHSFTVFWWKCLLFAMEHTGPTFIKLGQWASTRRDLFSAEFCELFYKLHSSTKRHSWFMTQRKLRKAFGKRWREIFVKIERKPVGSGCIAQVHRAYMKADMIPDESLIEECLEDLDDADHDEEVDFAEGLEIIGLGRLKDEMDDLMEEVQEVTSKHKQQQQQPQPQPAKVMESPPLESLENGQITETAQPSHEASSDSAASQLVQPDVTSVPAETEDDQEEILIPVAVKVLHPGIYRSFSRDLSILRLLARFFTAVVPSLRWLSLREAVEEFADLMTQQIDLRFEAECLEEFGQNFEDISFIRFPKPVRPYCKRDVIVETFEEGEPIANFLKEDADCPSGLKEQLAIYGVDALLKMIFVDNLVHGDLHPGNILVQNAADFVPPEESMNKLMLLDVCDTVIVNLKQVDNPVRLVLLDVGIATMLSEKDRRNFTDVFTAIVIGEGEKVAELMLNHARYNECTDIEGFKHDLGEIVCKARQETIKLGKIRAGDLLSNVFSILSKYRVKMESSFASILLAIFVLEGLGRSLDPELDLLERAKPTLLSS